MKIKSIIKSVVLLKLLRWFVTIILLVPISLYIISFLISDEQLFTWLVDRVQIETNTTMSYSSDVHFSRGMTPELQVNNLNLTENNHGYTARVSSLRVQLDLFELLKGRVNIPILEVGDVKVVINSSSDDSKEDNTSLPEILFDLSRLQIIPVIHQANFGKITVEFEGKNWQHDVNQISKLKLNINATRQIPIFTADVKVEKQQLHIDVFLPDLSQSLKNRKLPFSFKVDGRFITAEIAGDIDLQSNQPTIKAFYNATIQDLTHIPLNNALELPGNIVLKGKVEGSLSEPVLNDIQVTWDTLRSGKMSLIGKIGNITAGNQIDLSLTGALPELPESQWLQKHLPEYLPIDNVKVNTQISGSFEHLIFHELAINAKANVKTKEPLDLGLNGSVHAGYESNGGSLVSMARLQQVTEKYDFDVGDTEGHIFHISKSEGINTSTGKNSIMDGALVVNNNFSNLVKGNGSNQGYIILNKDGSTTVAKWEGKVTTVLSGDIPKTTMEGNCSHGNTG